LSDIEQLPSLNQSDLSRTTGQPDWTESAPGSGLCTVTGSLAMYESGQKIVAETF
jgi:hypothetical protein